MLSGEQLSDGSSFAVLLDDYVNLVSTSSTAKTEAAEVAHEKLTGLIWNGRVEYAEVVKAFATILARYPTHRLFLLVLLRDIANLAKTKGGYAYPEFFWIALQAGILSQFEKVSDLASILVDLVDSSTVRSYLTLKFADATGGAKLDILKAFYYVGHTVDSLQFILQDIAVQQENVDLLNVLYTDAVKLLNRQGVGLSRDEELYLQHFFESGLSLGHAEIQEHCFAALKQLNREADL